MELDDDGLWIDNLEGTDTSPADDRTTDDDDSEYGAGSPLIDYDDQAVAAGFDKLYEVDEDLPADDSTPSRGKTIGISGIPTNPHALVTAVEARDRYGIPLSRIHRWHFAGRVQAVDRRGIHHVYRAPDLRRLNRQAEQDSRSGPRPIEGQAA